MIISQASHNDRSQNITRHLLHLKNILLLLAVPYVTHFRFFWN